MFENFLNKYVMKERVKPVFFSHKLDCINQPILFYITSYYYLINFVLSVCCVKKKRRREHYSFIIFYHISFNREEEEEEERDCLIIIIIFSISFSFIFIIDRGYVRYERYSFKFRYYNVTRYSSYIIRRRTGGK